MQTVTVEEAQSQLAKLIAQISEGEDVIITQDDQSIAKLVPVEMKKSRRQPGTAKGRVWMAPDFDEPLEDFNEYMS